MKHVVSVCEEQIIFPSRHENRTEQNVTYYTTVDIFFSQDFWPRFVEELANRRHRAISILARGVNVKNIANLRSAHGWFFDSCVLAQHDELRLLVPATKTPNRLDDGKPVTATKPSLVVYAVFHSPPAEGVHCCLLWKGRLSASSEFRKKEK